jgi:hypothetical protein
MWGRYFVFLFGAQGLKQLYDVEEEDASFPRATRDFLSLKVPNQITDLFLTGPAASHRGRRRCSTPAEI